MSNLTEEENKDSYSKDVEFLNSKLSEKGLTQYQIIQSVSDTLNKADIPFFLFPVVNGSDNKDMVTMFYNLCAKFNENGKNVAQYDFHKLLGGTMVAMTDGVFSLLKPLCQKDSTLTLEDISQITHSCIHKAPEIYLNSLKDDSTK